MFEFSHASPPVKFALTAAVVNGDKTYVSTDTRETSNLKWLGFV